MAKIHFLHIPKTGGTAFKQAFSVKGSRPKDLILNGHGVTFQDVVETPSTQCVFFVRDIVSRFVSGFNSRLRRGRPFTDAGWDEGETVAFKRFPTANDLAEGLSSASIVTRRAATCAMANIWHTRFPLHFWLHSTEFLEKHKDRILFIARQDHLQQDFDSLLRLLDCDSVVSLPTDEVRSHKTPAGFSTELSQTGARNIFEWYREDAEILDWCTRWNDVHEKGC